jgi:hypothetical protein
MRLTGRTTLIFTRVSTCFNPHCLVNTSVAIDNIVVCQNCPITGPTMECFRTLILLGGLMTSCFRTLILLDRQWNVWNVSELSYCWTDNGMFGMFQNSPIAGWTDDVMFENPPLIATNIRPDCRDPEIWVYRICES